MMMPFIHFMSEPYRHRLVATLQHSGAIRSPQIARTFETIPREIFVPSFYQRAGGQTWEQWTFTDKEPDQWLAMIYQDEPLVTRLDERNWPISSSSAPSVMAIMLEALDLQPGMSVLEIGTGTGYNAAILAQLTGNPALVTTIDVDAELIQQAEKALHEVVGPVYVEACDGRLGEKQHAPYDRIIATASAPYIPLSWYEQLASGGRLVMDLQGSLAASGFLVIDKLTTETAHGFFRQPSLSFMQLLGSPFPHAIEVRALFQQPVAQEIWLKPDDLFPALLQNGDFRWFLQWFWSRSGYLTISQPGIMTKANGQKQAFVELMDRTNKTILRLSQNPDGGWSGRQRGSYPLWGKIQEAAKLFLSLGRPKQEAYTVKLDVQQASMFVAPCNGSPLLLCDLYLRTQNT